MPLPRDVSVSVRHPKRTAVSAHTSASDYAADYTCNSSNCSNERQAIEDGQGFLSRQRHKWSIYRQRRTLQSQRPNGRFAQFADRFDGQSDQSGHRSFGEGTHQ